MSGLQYLLDTNVLSETRKRQADSGVTAFLSAAEPTALFLSVLSIGEFRKGVSMKRRTDLDAARILSTWVDGLEFSFSDHILAIDSATASIWGDLSAQRSRPVIDTLLAATAIRHGFIFVTRNTADVEDTGVKLLNPWR